MSNPLVPIAKQPGVYKMQQGRRRGIHQMVETGWPADDISGANGGMMTRAVSADALSSMIAAIYDAAVDPKLWPAALQAVCDELDFGAAVMGLMPLSGARSMLSAAVGIDQPWRDKLEKMAGEALTFWGGAEVLLSQPISEPTVLSRIRPGALDADSSEPFYENYARPLQFTDISAVPLGREPGWLGVVSFARRYPAAKLTDADIGVMRLLVPHFQRAAAINQLLNVQSLAAETFKSVLNALSAPTIIVDDQESVVFANVAALAVLERGDPIAIRNGRLIASATGLRQALQVALAQCISNEGALDGKGYGIPVRNSAGAAQAIHVLPLGRGEIRPVLLPRGAAAVFLSMSSAPAPVPSEIVTALFGLTASESLVFRHVAGGRSVGETADALAVTRSTIRTHLLRIFEKTNVHRQSDLVRLARSFANPADTESRN